ncbi:hypothetical protein J8M21_20650 [Pseudoalteromonas luteoviolacea]|uniref:hypothetical protein n=1 Tax=Pseudoalteromonas luteoviolacea TaxID=43657 RepID=UPI001B39F81B|nr:hypothetical protein [Pseudoalteromonas luteoviolacea]MBQ4879631.1 hypothetical protein [Pseudoalteromonas luteoviolacea]MBQ4909161.1 hypothetical protein [Pseudoalteromonas luteoviolacea]
MEHLPLPKPPKSCVFRLVPNSHLHVSKTNNASEVYDLEGAFWEFEIELTNVLEADALALDAFLAKCRGSVGKFLCFDYRFLQDDLDSFAMVTTSFQDGNLLKVAGLPVNSVYAKSGNRIQIGTGENAELKILTADVVVDSHGACELEFESPMRQIPASNTPVYFKRPAGVFRLLDNKQGLAEAQVKNGFVTAWKIKGREAF